MKSVVREMPVQRSIVIPLALLSELASHEQQLLSGVGVHEGIEQAEIRNALPAVAGHLREHRTLAVHDFVMRERQDVVFAEGVDQTERDATEMVFPVERILAHE